MKQNKGSTSVTNDKITSFKSKYAIKSVRSGKNEKSETKSKNPAKTIDMDSSLDLIHKFINTHISSNSFAENFFPYISKHTNCSSLLLKESVHPLTGTVRAISEILYENCETASKLDLASSVCLSELIEAVIDSSILNFTTKNDKN